MPYEPKPKHEEKHETEHARAKRHFTEEQEKATQEKAKAMQEDQDRQQGIVPEKKGR